MSDQQSDFERPQTENSGHRIRSGFLKLRRYWFVVGMLLVAMALWAGYHAVRSQTQKMCRKAQQEERWEDLETLSRRWTDWEPHEADAWLYLADAVQHQNRFLEAAEYLGEIPVTSLKAAKAFLVQAELLFGPANQPLDGEVACRKLLKLEPRAAKAHALLIRFYAYTLQRKKLAEQFKEAIRLGLEPKDAYIYYLLTDSLNMSQGVELNTLWLTTSPEEEVFLVARALQWREQHNTQAGETADVNADAVMNEREMQVLNLLERFPNNSNLLADQIDAEIVKGRLNRVVELLSQAPADAETDNRFWRYKGWVHYAKQEFGEAEEAYRTALKLHPMDWQSMNRLLEVLRSRQETAEIERIQALVARIQDLRTSVRSIETIEDCPLELLRILGQVARDCGDSLVGDALRQRLGNTDGARP
jgi:tetratricopeptide (TPR) repeat protein